jgi:hypothetical protein
VTDCAGQDSYSAGLRLADVQFQNWPKEHWPAWAPYGPVAGRDPLSCSSRLPNPTNGAGAGAVARVGVELWDQVIAHEYADRSVGVFLRPRQRTCPQWQQGLNDTGGVCHGWGVASARNSTVPAGRAVGLLQLRLSLQDD